MDKQKIYTRTLEAIASTEQCFRLPLSEEKLKKSVSLLEKASDGFHSLGEGRLATRLEASVEHLEELLVQVKHDRKQHRDNSSPFVGGEGTHVVLNIAKDYIERTKRVLDDWKETGA